MSAAAGPAESQSALPGGLVVEVPPGPFALGERFELVVRCPSAALASGAELSLGELPAGLRAEELRRSEHEGVLELRQTLRATHEGSQRLAGLEVLAGEVRHALPPVSVEVVLELPVGVVPQVAEPLPPPAIPGEVPWPWILGLALALAIVLVLVRRARRRPGPPPAPPRPPDLVAAEALARLRLHLPGTPEDVPAFVEAVSGILRTYVEERFGVRAPECTSEEFLAEVATRHDALAAHREALDRFLGQCDLVKFAGWRPQPPAITPLLDVAEAFLEATRLEMGAAVGAQPALAAPAGGAP
ncbi:MAG: hypothetical protein ACT4PU_05550 [Planctomycetota bacterium]